MHGLGGRLAGLRRSRPTSRCCASACTESVNAFQTQSVAVANAMAPSNVLPLVTKPKATPLLLPVKIGDIDAFLLDCVKTAPRSRLSWVDAFVRYRAWCAERNETPVDVSAFGGHFDALRTQLGLETRTKGKEVFFVGLKFASYEEANNEIDARTRHRHALLQRAAACSYRFQVLDAPNSLPATVQPNRHYPGSARAKTGRATMGGVRNGRTLGVQHSEGISPSAAS